jgi:hypothetical protein
VCTAWCVYLQCVLHGVYICSVYCMVCICSVYCMVCIFAVCTVWCVFAVCTAWCVYLHCRLLYVGKYSVNHTIYLYLVSININCTHNVDVTHCVLSLICVFFLLQCMLFSVFISVSLYFVLLFCSFYFSSKTSMKFLFLSTHSQQGEDEDPMV